MKNLYLLIAACLLTVSNAFAFDHSHKVLDDLLSAHVKMSADKTSSRVDYKNFDKTRLGLYLGAASSLSKKDFNAFTKDQKLAFFINTYNAFTIKLILDNYPVKSIKDTGVRSFSNPLKNPWKMKFFKLFGKKTSLDQIEHVFTRGNKQLNQDPRIHFAFNCAAIGCPALSNSAWQASKIESQFDTAAKGFLKDHSRNRVNVADKTLELNDIFKWYGDDFNRGKYGSLKNFLAEYADAISQNEKEKNFVLSKSFSINSTGYDWNLNKH